MTLEHYKYAKAHLAELETVLLNTYNTNRTALLLELTKLQLEAGKLALDLGISSAEPVTPEPPAAPRAKPSTDSAKPITKSARLEVYDHAAVLEKDLFSEGKRKLLFVVGGKLYNLKGDQLHARLLEDANKVTQKSVAHLHLLNFKDGNKILELVKSAAVAAGVWTEGAR